MKIKIKEIQPHITQGNEKFILIMETTITKEQLAQVLKNSNEFEVDVKWW